MSAPVVGSARPPDRRRDFAGEDHTQGWRAAPSPTISDASGASGLDCDLVRRTNQPWRRSQRHYDPPRPTRRPTARRRPARPPDRITGQLWDELAGPCSLPAWFSRNLDAWSDTLYGGISATLDDHPLLIIKLSPQRMFAADNEQGQAFIDVSQATRFARVHLTGDPADPAS
ncbi:MAG: barstar family protein [Streptosporangiaceae bacterium]